MTIPTKLILVSGFLGAGKTTLMLRAAKMLAQQNYRVGLITNDQGSNLVDTTLVADQAIPVTEVAGGCFCCRFPDLLQAIERLQETVRPHIILAEPVGSCTDLVATILHPLQRYYPEQTQLAPLTVLFDAQRDLDQFSPDVAYLYQQQLAEADLLLLNKIDLLSPEQCQHQQIEMGLLAPQAQVMMLSAQSGDGVEPWLHAVMSTDMQTHQPLDLDYQRYAIAEAELGWLNAQGVLVGSAPFLATGWATTFLSHLAELWTDQGTPIGHVKMSLKTNDALLKVSLTQQGQPLTWEDHHPETPTDHVEFILNARVGSAPQLLEETVRQTFDRIKPDLQSRYLFPHFQAFSPPAPQPTHRLL